MIVFNFKFNEYEEQIGLLGLFDGQISGKQWVELTFDERWSLLNGAYIEWLAKLPMCNHMKYSWQRLKNE